MLRESVLDRYEDTKTLILTCYSFSSKQEQTELLDCFNHQYRLLRRNINEFLAFCRDSNFFKRHSPMIFIIEKQITHIIQVLDEEYKTLAIGISDNTEKTDNAKSTRKSSKTDKSQKREQCGFIEISQKNQISVAMAAQKACNTQSNSCLFTLLLKLKTEITQVLYTDTLAERRDQIIDKLKQELSNCTEMNISFKRTLGVPLLNNDVLTSVIVPAPSSVLLKVCYNKNIVKYIISFLVKTEILDNLFHYKSSLTNSLNVIIQQTPMNVLPCLGYISLSLLHFGSLGFWIRDQFLFFQNFKDLWKTTEGEYGEFEDFDNDIILHNCCRNRFNILGNYTNGIVNDPHDERKLCKSRKSLLFFDDWIITNVVSKKNTVNSTSTKLELIVPIRNSSWWKFQCAPKRLENLPIRWIMDKYELVDYSYSRDDSIATVDTVDAVNIRHSFSNHRSKSNLYSKLNCESFKSSLAFVKGEIGLKVIALTCTCNRIDVVDNYGACSEKETCKRVKIHGKIKEIYITDCTYGVSYIDVEPLGDFDSTRYRIYSLACIEAF